MLLTLAPLVLSAFALQAPPNQLHFQARLSDAGGNPLAGPLSVTLLVYDVPSGGAPLYVETHAATALNGVVNLPVGSVSALPASLFDGSTRFMTLKVNADPEMFPRRPIVSTPFALRSGSAAALTPTTTIPNGLITSAHLLDGTVSAADLAPNAVGISQLASSAVTSAKLASASVTSGKIAADAVDSSAILDGTIGFKDVAVGGLTAATLAAGAVTSAAILDGTVVAADLASPVTGSAPAVPVLTIEHLAVGGTALRAINQTTGTSGAGIEAESAALLGIGVFATATGGFGNAVAGHAFGTSGTGVVGQSFALTGSPRGVSGLAASTQGIGVSGSASATSGATRGVEGSSSSTSGNGVRGIAFAASGAAHGVVGQTLSPAGFGVLSLGNTGSPGLKNFIQPHPTDPSREIRFVCLEGNEAGTYFRGTSKIAGGTAVIDVPEEFRLVSEAKGLTVQLTPIGAAVPLAILSKSLERITVGGPQDVEFDYFVHGVRRGFADFRPMHENRTFAPETRGVPYGAQYPEAFRRILVENGILNSDFTPNEATANRLGFELRDPEDTTKRIR